MKQRQALAARRGRARGKLLDGVVVERDYRPAGGRSDQEPRIRVLQHRIHDLSQQMRPRDSGHRLGVHAVEHQRSGTTLFASVLFDRYPGKWVMIFFGSLRKSITALTKRMKRVESLRIHHVLLVASYINSFLTSQLTGFNLDSLASLG